ncbi:hypothetical protein GW17_00018208 [Ensete ventricosum]|nr:hypothetical protein GW17_00018208 [Ensete ventricosum]
MGRKRRSERRGKRGRHGRRRSEDSCATAKTRKEEPREMTKDKRVRHGIGKAGGRGKGKLDHHIVSAVGESARENKVGGDENDNPQDKEEELRDNYELSIGLVNAHLSETRLEAPELVIIEGDATYIRCPAK